MSTDYNSKIEFNSSNESVCGSGDTVNIEENAMLQSLRQGIIETTEENIACRTDICKLLQELGIDLKTESNDIKEGLEKVSLILKSEHLMDIDDTMLRICREQKLINEGKKHREEKKVAFIQDTIYVRCSLLQKKVELLQQVVSSLKDSIIHAKTNEEKIYADKILLSKKFGDYQQALEKLKLELNKMDIADLYPDIIEKKYQQYLELTGELAELNQSLLKYGELPPNLLQAKALLANKQLEYVDLAKHFYSKTE